MSLDFKLSSQKIKNFGDIKGDIYLDDPEIVSEMLRLDFNKLKSEIEMSCVTSRISNTKYRVAGRIVSKRGRFFNILSDGEQIQCYLKDKDHLINKADIGDIVYINGKGMITKTGEPTIRVSKAFLVTKIFKDLPEKYHGLKNPELRYRNRYVDLISNPEAFNIFKTRSKIITLIREFLNKKSYMEVETPMMHPIAGGASAKPFITHHNTLDMDLYLRIAPELYLKRLLVGGFNKVYEINRNFRNEGISTRHNPEFTMIELYEAYGNMRSVMKTTMNLLHHIAEGTGVTSINRNGNIINLLSCEVKTMTKSILDKVIVDYHSTRLQSSLYKMETDGVINFINEISKIENPFYNNTINIKFRNLINTDYIKDLMNNKSNPDVGGILVNELFENLVEDTLIQPTFIINYPSCISPLAKRNNTNKHISQRFEFFMDGIEIGNGYSEQNDPDLQLSVFKSQFKDEIEMEKNIDKDFINALYYGMPPAGGLGIGIDRLVMMFTNAPSIREVILFPTLRNKGDE